MNWQISSETSFISLQEHVLPYTCIFCILCIHSLTLYGSFAFSLDELVHFLLGLILHPCQST